jgi:hypothetical protein
MCLHKLTEVLTVVLSKMSRLGISGSRKISWCPLWLLHIQSSLSKIILQLETHISYSEILPPVRIYTVCSPEMLLFISEQQISLDFLFKLTV